jgi:hypothetical protein
MAGNIFVQAAEYSRTRDPFAKWLLIIPFEGLPATYRDLFPLFPYPVLYVTAVGYIPYATKSEIVRRRDANLVVLGGEENVSEWVVYALSTLTKGRVYRISAA